MKRQFFALMTTAVIAVTLTACGGSSEPSPSSGAAGATGTASGLTLQQVKDAGVLKIGTEGTYKPFSFHEGGTGPLTGFDVEIATAVAGKLGVEPKFEETQWDGIFAGLDAGRFDVIANQVSITPERKAKYLFSTPYTVSTGVIVTKADNTDISSFADLNGKTTAQSLTSNWYQLAKDSGAKVEAVEGWAQAVTLLKQGRVDATINDKLTYLDSQKTKNDPSIKIAAETTDKSESAITFRKGSEDLVKAVDGALAELQADGTLAKISDKYFGADVTK
ncbi:amino acid ABC transporter substrate-binding protein [Paeniglutamicibacter kerguelensis]|uniref:Cystine transport system substrate-binding protein n=1 Tax=Paeniglutamicibacter kerguelensis TaxID=254788 RepID=A0ABS4XFI2_9MICC|nr:amino acid ABC transporter substrate-binding protein [Paeniglutamicibacter kerguelensis]MBP2387209.1 cystine transport system substrate-binding protein [Paeniglutamicibacter kerguelensis]